MKLLKAGLLSTFLVSVLAAANTLDVYTVDVEGGNDVVPLLVPPEFNQINIQKGQKFYFQVEVGDKGLLKAKAIKKV